MFCLSRASTSALVGSHSSMCGTKAWRVRRKFWNRCHSLEALIFIWLVSSTEKWNQPAPCINVSPELLLHRTCWQRSCCGRKLAQSQSGRVASSPMNMLCPASRLSSRLDWKWVRHHTLGFLILPNADRVSALCCATNWWAIS